MTPVKPKDQGTRAETGFVKTAQQAGCKAWRLAEAGSNDPGDVAVETPDGDTYIVEVKHRDRLSLHAEGEKTERKAADADLPFPVAGTALYWRRTTRDTEEGRRRFVGDGMWVSVAEWLELIQR